MEKRIRNISLVRGRVLYAGFGMSLQDLYNLANSPGKNPITAIPQSSGIGGVLAAAINILLGLGIAFSIVFLAIAGIQFMAARSDPKATETAQRALTYSVAAFLITVFSFALIQAIINLLGATVEPVPTNF